MESIRSQEHMLFIGLGSDKCFINPHDNKQHPPLNPPYPKCYLKLVQHTASSSEEAENLRCSQKENQTDGGQHGIRGVHLTSQLR